MAIKGLQLLTVQEAQNAALGQAGSTFIDDTAQHTGPYVAITAIEDSVVDVSDCTNIADTMKISEQRTAGGHGEGSCGRAAGGRIGLCAPS